MALTKHTTLLPNEKIKWNCIKIPFILFWAFFTTYALHQTNSFSINKGLCQLLNCNFILISSVKIVGIALIILLTILYLFERKMKLTLFALFVVSLIIYSAHESYGVQLRTGLIPLIFLAQYFAYQFFQKDPEKLYHNRIHYTVQVVVASYTLSALSKLITSGFSWFYDAKYMVLQMLKSNQTHYFDGIVSYESIHSWKVDFVLNNPIFIATLLLGALLIELTSSIGLINTKTRLIYGILLLIMHIGIFFFFNILIFPFIIPMVLFMINPFWLGYVGLRKLKPFLFNTH